VPSGHIQADVARIALDRVEGFPFDFAHQYIGTGRTRHPAAVDLVAARDGCTRPG
jgi:hypothetical protein